MAAKFPHQPQCQVELIHFFNIITVQNLHDGKLMIPNKFVEKYGESLLDTLVLMTPNGVEWKLSLEKQDGKIWFQKGWKEFAEYHSLAYGHLLVFRSQRTSHFRVHIFGLDALEIDYPSKRIDGKTASNNEGNKPPNDENSEYLKPGQKRKDNSSLEFIQPYQTRSRKCVRVENTFRLPKEAVYNTQTKCKEKSKAMANQVSAHDRASSFKSCNPFFLVVMRPSYVNSRGGSPLTLPSKFCKTHFHFALHEKIEINLQVLNQGIWPAKINTLTNFTVTTGWKPFVKHNNLKVGDVCIFELIPSTKLPYFLVHIFKKKESSNCSTSQEVGEMTTACQGQRKTMKIISATK